MCQVIDSGPTNYIESVDIDGNTLTLVDQYGDEVDFTPTISGSVPS